MIRKMKPKNTTVGRRKMTFKRVERIGV